MTIPAFADRRVETPTGEAVARRHDGTRRALSAAPAAAGRLEG